MSSFMSRCLHANGPAQAIVSVLTNVNRRFMNNPSRDKKRNSREKRIESRAFILAAATTFMIYHIITLPRRMYLPGTSTRTPSVYCPFSSAGHVMLPVSSANK